MKDFLIIIGAIGLGLVRPNTLHLQHLKTGPNSNSMRVRMVAPTAGSVVSNTITLTAEAFSSAAPIARVEFYVTDPRTGVKTLIGVATNVDQGVQ